MPRLAAVLPLVVLASSIWPSIQRSEPQRMGLPAQGRPADAGVPFGSQLPRFQENQSANIWMDDFSAPRNERNGALLDRPTTGGSPTAGAGGGGAAARTPPYPPDRRNTRHATPRPFPRRDGGSDRMIVPITYRYYARQRARRQGSVPFLLLGNNNLDHWKDVAERLAKQGFNSMVVLVNESSEGVRLVLQVLEALSWKRVVIVASETTASTFAIRAATQLPDTVLGMVLCGEIQEREMVLDIHQQHRTAPSALQSLDQVLLEKLKCPFTIVWDGGGKESFSSPSTVNEEEEELFPEELRPQRTVLVGGGSAPHRRSPDLFSWILTRFVEEKVEHYTNVEKQQRQADSAQQFRSSSSSSSLDAVWNEESMVVFGRVVATALFYGIAIRILFFQYDHVRDISRWVLTTKQNVFNRVHKIVAGLLAVLLPWSKTGLLDGGDGSDQPFIEGEYSVSFVPFNDNHGDMPSTIHAESATGEAAPTTEDDSSGANDEDLKEDSSFRDGSEQESLGPDSSVAEVAGEEADDLLDDEPHGEEEALGEDSTTEQKETTPDDEEREGCTPPSLYGSEGSNKEHGGQYRRPICFLDHVVT